MNYEIDIDRLHTTLTHRLSSILTLAGRKMAKKFSILRPASVKISQQSVLQLRSSLVTNTREQESFYK